MNFSCFKGIVPTLVGTQKWKPDKEELEKELRRLGLAKEDVKINKLEDEIVLDPENPIENVSSAYKVQEHFKRSSFRSSLCTYRPATTCGPTTWSSVSRARTSTRRRSTTGSRGSGETVLTGN